MFTGDDMMQLMLKNEPLCDELLDYFESEAGDMPMVRHPLIYSVPHSNSLNAFLNKQLEVKKEAAAQYLKEKEYDSFVFLHERPFRLHTFLSIRHKLSDKEYWNLASSIWTDSENINVNRSIWKIVLKSKRSSGEYFMQPEDRNYLLKLPQTITVFRGCNETNKNGLSWTLDKKVAEKFAGRFSTKYNGSTVLTKTINKNKVFAYLSSRSEKEIIIL